MIGVIANPTDQDVVREFFELFKTPWEFYRSNAKYDVILCGDGVPEGSAKLVLFYAGKKLAIDDEQGIGILRESSKPSMLSYRGSLIPIYGDSITLSGKGISVLTNEEVQESAACLVPLGDAALARIGYNLFDEVRRLLTAGQPAANAGIPTLELHIAFLRDLVIDCGIPLLEIPPVPDGFQFLVCLTHDVDHPSIRRHKCDHTMWGFLYRAIFGSVGNFARGRMSLGSLFTNWLAALKLPFVYLGLAKDPWGEFVDRYREIEKPFRSTFFVIPFANHPGNTSNGPAPRMRSARYGARDLAGKIEKLAEAGCEIGLHGIDAWLDSTEARQELEEIRRGSGSREIGVRMHWLYHGEQTPKILETAGATYDSTVGYNETVGYRAGTTQAYRPLQASHLLELPLHIMDTALFYPGYLGLSPKETEAVLDRMVGNAVRFEGCLTINWHDRSLAPERLWGRPYLKLVQDLQSRGAWCSTAGEAVSWFRKRRAVKFIQDPTDAKSVRVNSPFNCFSEAPGLRVRIYQAQESRRERTLRSVDYIRFVDTGGAERTCASRFDEQTSAQRISRT